MQLAQTLPIEELADKSRIFNLTDELLTMSSAYPAFPEKFKNLTDILMEQVLKQPEVRQLMSRAGIYFIKGIGISMCHFETLSVFHYIRMSQEEIESVHQHFNDTKLGALDIYTKAQFRSGPLGVPDDEIRLFHFKPSNRLGYRVDHMMQVLPHNKHHVQQYFADMAIVTAAGGKNG